MKNLFYLLLIVLISGCSLKQEVTDVNSYSIDFNSKNKSYQTIDNFRISLSILCNKISGLKYKKSKYSHRKKLEKSTKHIQGF